MHCTAFLQRAREKDDDARLASWVGAGRYICVAWGHSDYQRGLKWADLKRQRSKCYAFQYFAGLHTSDNPSPLPQRNCSRPIRPQPPRKVDGRSLPRDALPQQDLSQPCCVASVEGKGGCLFLGNKEGYFAIKRHSLLIEDYAVRVRVRVRTSQKIDPS